MHNVLLNRMILVGSGYPAVVLGGVPGEAMADAEGHVNGGRVGVSVDGGPLQVVGTYATRAAPHHRLATHPGLRDAYGEGCELGDAGRAAGRRHAVMLSSPPGGRHPLILPPGS